MALVKWISGVSCPESPEKRRGNRTVRGVERGVGPNGTGGAGRTTSTATTLSRGRCGMRSSVSGRVRSRDPYVRLPRTGTLFQRWGPVV